MLYLHFGRMVCGFRLALSGGCGLVSNVIVAPTSKFKIIFEVLVFVESMIVVPVIIITSYPFCALTNSMFGNEVEFTKQVKKVEGEAEVGGFLSRGGRSLVEKGKMVKN